MAITKKLIRSVWINYMIAQYTKEYSKKYGAFNPNVHQIQDSGDVRIRNAGGLVLEEVGIDYRTFRMKYNTSDNPVENPNKKQVLIDEV